VEISVLNLQESLSISTCQVQDLVREVIDLEGLQVDEVALHFVPASIICDLHKQYFDDPTPTDCISFPVSSDTDDSEEYNTLGDVFVCTDVAIAYARSHNLDPYEELSLYIVHGLLHLIGYDDISEEDCSEMRAAEARHMENLKKRVFLLKEEKL